MLLVLGCASLTVIAHDAKADETEYQEITGAQLAAARNWYLRNTNDLESIRSMPAEIRAMIVNSMTYRFCRNSGVPAPPSLDLLFQDCDAACGGITYVFRGLARAVGLDTRYARLWNIPNQGNHVVVEVRIGEDKWAMFDPTFGVFFRPHDSGDFSAVSLAEVSLMQPDQLLRSVAQADRNAPSGERDPRVLYAGEYDHPYMPIENYAMAEAVSHDRPDEMVILTIPMNLKRGRAVAGDWDAQDADSLSRGWLDYTNSTLLDKDPWNDTSYNASQLMNNQEKKVTIVSFGNLEKGSRYRLRLRLVNQSGRQHTLQLGPLARSLRLESASLIPVPEGVTDITVNMEVSNPRAQMFIRNTSAENVISLLAIEITAYRSSKRGFNLCGFFSQVVPRLRNQCGNQDSLPVAL